MTEAPADLVAAEARAARARLRLDATVAELRIRLEPATLYRTAAREAKLKGSAAAQASVNTAIRNPGAVAGWAAAAGLFLARHRIAGLFRRRHRVYPTVAAPQAPAGRLTEQGASAPNKRNDR